MQKDSAFFSPPLSCHLFSNLTLLTFENFCYIFVSRRIRTAEVWITDPVSYPLDHEALMKYILWELPDILCCF
jgi:hypothetical protein